MKIDDLELIKRIIEGALMAADTPLNKRALKDLFDELELPEDDLIDQAIAQLESDCEPRGYELKQVASGYRFQVKQDLGRWISKLWKERAPRYSRALLETLSLVAYRQPITRGEIEDIRGVAVSTQIIKTLLEREWVKVVGHRDVPGRPAIYATTKQFLDYFNLKSLDQLPPLAEIRELGAISRDFNIELPIDAIEPANDAGPDGHSSDAAHDETHNEMHDVDQSSAELEDLPDQALTQLGDAQPDADDANDSDELAALENWREQPAQAQDRQPVEADASDLAEVQERQVYPGEPGEAQAEQGETYQDEHKAQMSAGASEHSLKL